MMLVSELRDLLTKHLEEDHPDTPVWVEGCDCLADAVGISLFEHDALIIRQEHGDLAGNPYRGPECPRTPGP